MIGWYVHHVGRGHATRAAAVAAHLRHPVTGLGSGPAPRGWPGEWVTLERDDEGSAPSEVTAHGRLHWVPVHNPGLAARSARLTRWIADARPAVVVVDVSVEAALLARLSGVPVVVTALPGDRGDAAHRLAHDLAEAILAPWPAGTHDAGWPARWSERAWTVGAMSRFDDRPLRAPRRSATPRVLLLWGAGGRSVSAADVAAARTATPAWEWSEWSGDRVDPTEASDALWEGMLDADVVVTHAGQNAVAEVAAARRPAVVVAQPRPFDEQRATARVLDRAGIAVGLDAWPAPGAWPSLLERAAALGGAEWSRWNPGDAARTVAARLDALVASTRGAAA